MNLFLQTVVNGLIQSSIYMMISIGLALLFGILGIVNFAQGDFLALTGYVGMAVLGAVHKAYALAALAIAASGIAIGVVFYGTVVAPTRRQPHVNRLLASFGLSLLIEGVIQQVWSARYRSVSISQAAFHLGGVTIPATGGVSFVVALGALLALFAGLRWTVTGRSIRASAQNATGAALVGIDVRRMELVTCIVAGLLCGFGGATLLSSYYLFPTVGQGFIFEAFAIVVVAGLGNMGNVIVVSLLLGLADAFSSTYLSGDYAQLFVLSLTFVALITWRSGDRGLVARHA